MFNAALAVLAAVWSASAAPLVPTFVPTFHDSVTPDPAIWAESSVRRDGGVRTQRAGLSSGDAVHESVHESVHDAVRDAMTPPPVAREFRAAWISPIGDGSTSDWPSKAGLSVDEQKAELRALLDKAKAFGLNAVIFHVRTAGDALYASKDVPWSAFLTGVSGKDPGYDPLAFAIQEAHARGLQLHAWFNPFRAMLPNFAGRAAATHVTREHPEWIRKYGSQTWIDPGNPDARRAVMAAIMDVVRRYDVDGVHLDDYFYPYRESETIVKRVHHRKVRIRRDIAFPDDKTWKKYGERAGWTDRADWRRNNINEFIETLYQQVKAAKPWVLVGISPFGIWRSGTPRGVTGLDAYGEIYADSRLWLKKGWLDYLAPQLYWPIDGVQNRFVELDRWWLEPAQNPQGRYVWPGLGTFAMRSGRWSQNEIETQIATVRNDRLESADIPGHVHFRLGSLSRDDGYLGDMLRQSVYATPALVPAFPWLGDGASVRAGAPHVVAKPVAGQADSLWHLIVDAGDSIPVAWWLVQQRQMNGTWTAQLYRASRDIFAIDLPTPGDVDAIAVRAIGRTGETGAFSSVSLRW